MVEEYVRNTHAKTHSQYKLKVTHVFRASRDGEAAAHRSQLGNRQLLWHGSRLTNWVGILSQGLRIAPPEAPVTGYMFGKGVYFADMVSKSANYCFARCVHVRIRNDVRAHVRVHVHARGHERVLVHEQVRVHRAPACVHARMHVPVRGLSRASPMGVLLLSDVALGKQYKRLASEYEAAASCRRAAMPVPMHMCTCMHVATCACKCTCTH